MTNMAMDMLVLAVGIRLGGGRLSLRVIPASLLGAAYALACAAMGGGIASFPAQAAMLAMMAAIAGQGSPRDRGRQAFCCAVTALFLGGMVQWTGTGVAGVPLVTPAAALALLACNDRRRLRLSELTVRIRVDSGRGTACFDALIDTGNRLRVPADGSPVLIAEERLIRSIVPEEGVRRVPYGGLGGTGFLTAFPPVGLSVRRDGVWSPAKGIWVASYRGRMAGGVHALAPPELALR